MNRSICGVLNGLLTSRCLCIGSPMAHTFTRGNAKSTCKGISKRLVVVRLHICITGQLGSTATVVSVECKV